MSEGLIIASFEVQYNTHPCSDWREPRETLQSMTQPKFEPSTSRMKVMVFWECRVSEIWRRTVVSYGAQAWTLTKKEEQALLIF